MQIVAIKVQTQPLKTLSDWICIEIEIDLKVVIEMRE